MREYRQKYPQQRANADAMRPEGEERYYPPSGYNESADHHRNFLEAVRTQKPVVEDATFRIPRVRGRPCFRTSVISSSACANGIRPP